MPLPAEVKGLIFDCDGTLLDTMPLHWKAWCAICKETGLKFDKESFFALAGVPGREIIRELANQQGINLDPHEVYARKRSFFLKGLQSVKIIPCVVRFVLEARRLGIPTAVASGSSRVQVEQGIWSQKIFTCSLDKWTVLLWIVFPSCGRLFSVLNIDHLTHEKGQSPFPQTLQITLWPHKRLILSWSLYSLLKSLNIHPTLKLKRNVEKSKTWEVSTLHDHKLIAAARDVNKFQLKPALVLGTTRELHEMWSEHFNIVYVIERIFVLFTSLFMTLNSSDRSWDSWLVRRNCWKRRLSECETSSWRIPYSCRKIGYKPSRLLGVWRLVSISRFFRLNVLFNRIYMALQSNSLAHSSFFNNSLSSNWSQMTFKGGKNK